MPVEKAEAIRRLIAAGYRNVAEELSRWRNRIGNSGGWDGWLRGQYPALVGIVWTN